MLCGSRDGVEAMSRRRKAPNTWGRRFVPTFEQVLHMSIRSLGNGYMVGARYKAGPRCPRSSPRTEMSYCMWNNNRQLRTVSKAGKT